MAWRRSTPILRECEHVANFLHIEQHRSKGIQTKQTQIQPRFHDKHEIETSRPQNHHLDAK